MGFLFIGFMAFVLVCIFDLNKIRFHHKAINTFFGISAVLMVIATFGILLGEPGSFQLDFNYKFICGVLGFAFLLLLVYSQFFWLPFRVTYLETAKKNAVVDWGMYALCRHPGVIWFSLCCLFLWLTSGKTLMMWAWILWTLMDILLVYIEDRWIFPAILDGYTLYKEKVPFLIPNMDSIKNAILHLRRPDVNVGES
jgi:protein-S-isoprenylcysteine O-methyltransferase Ste14